jgi:hypothetical protein
MSEMLHGKGTYTWPTGSRYEGEFNDNVKQGTCKGVMACLDGAKYVGDWQNNKKHVPSLFHVATETSI